MSAIKFFTKSCIVFASRCPRYSPVIVRRKFCGLDKSETEFTRLTGCQVGLASLLLKLVEYCSYKNDYSEFPASGGLTYNTLILRQVLNASESAEFRILKLCYRARLAGDDGHIGGAVSQTHSFVLVLHRIGQLHQEFMTLAVQGFWLESQFVAKMELP